MAKKPQTQQPEASLLREHADKARPKLDARIKSGQEIMARIEEGRRSTVAFDLDAREKEYEQWTTYNVDLLRALFTSERIPTEYSWAGPTWAANKSASPAVRVVSLTDVLEKKINSLESIRGRLDLFPLAANTAKGALDAPRQTMAADPKRVFLVHGHDEAALAMVARFLGQLDLSPIILHEQVSEGRTLVEKLEHYSDVSFAVVLLTPDDMGSPVEAAGKLRPRARQNVVLELGYFVGLLGRSRVCALHKGDPNGDLELPSDYSSVVYVRLDDPGAWKLELARELKAAGLEVDMNEAI